MSEKPCLVCGKDVPDYKPEYCCNGTDCGCRGLPTEPCVCPEHWEEFMGFIGGAK